MNAVKRPYCSQIREENFLSLLANMHTYFEGRRINPLNKERVG
jgi:hypothetical protein